MDERKVQRAGNTTYTVSLPKAWADENGVTSGSTVRLYPQESSLLLTLGDHDAVSRELDVSAMDADELHRALATMYQNGVDEMVLVADRITTQQRRAIQETAMGLIGAEILEETRSQVVVKSILDATSLSIESALGQIRSLALTMLEEAVAAVVEGDDDLARSVTERDDEVDRLWLFVARRLRMSLHSPPLEQDLHLSRERRLDYYDATRQLERIADSAAEIGDLTLDMEALPAPLTSPLQSAQADIGAAVELAIEAILTDDIDHSRELVSAARRRIDEAERSMHDIDEGIEALDPHQIRRAGLLGNALLRSASYAWNIGEIALHRAYPRP